jgi:hypothetical protein
MKVLGKGRIIMFPLFSVAPIVLQVINGVGATRFLLKHISDRIISGKIGKFVAHGKTMMQECYSLFLWNLKLSIVLNVIIITLALLAWNLKTITTLANDIVLGCISLISIFMMLRWAFRTIRSVKWMYPYRYTFSYFLNVFINTFSFKNSVYSTIRMAYNKIYDENTNKIGRFTHNVFSALRFVKSSDEIGDDIVNEFYCLIHDFFIRYIVYRVIALTVFYSIFIFLLKPLVFNQTLQMNLFEIVFYPVLIIKRLIHSL